MKKRVAVFLVLAMMLALSGCGDLRTPESTPTVPSTGGVDDGRIGDVIQTYFYEFVVNDAQLVDDFHGYTPGDGNRLLVVDVTIHNTTKETIPMADAEFILLWDDEDGIAVPVTSDPETGDEALDAYVNRDQIPYEFDLAIDEQRWGYLVYEVPSGNTDFALVTEDTFDTGDEGDLYVVYFTAGDAAQD